MSETSTQMGLLQTLKQKDLLDEAGTRSLAAAKVRFEKAAKKLKRLQSNTSYQQKHRNKKKEKLSLAIGKFPDLQADLACMTRLHPGQPNLESRSEFSELHRVILDLVGKGAAADGRRRSEVVHSARTLDDLVDRLAEEGNY